MMECTVNRLAALLALLLLAPAARAAGPADTNLPALSAAPAFSVRALDGRVVRLRRPRGGGVVRLGGRRGRPVVLDFWATWCVPCRVTMPQLDTLQIRYRDRGL